MGPKTASSGAAPSSIVPARREVHGAPGRGEPGERGNVMRILFLLGLVEGPGNMMGMILANKIGRRWTHTGLLGINTVILGVLMGVVMYQTDPDNMYWSGPVISFLCMWVKMNISATFVVAYIQVCVNNINIVHQEYL